MLAVVILIAFRARKRVQWRAFLAEVAIIVAAYWIYFFVRAFTEGDRDRAIANGYDIVELEKSLGFYWEPHIQELWLKSDTLVTITNWFYIVGFWPIIVLTGAWLLTRDRRRYQRMRNAFLISGGIGVLIFATFPVAPPRFLDLGLIDTVVAQNSAAYQVLQPSDFTNQYAAVPSFHFGWLLLVGIAIAQEVRHRAVRILAFVPAVAMLLTIIVTANHYIFDPMAGALISVTGLAIATQRQNVRATAPIPAEPARVRQAR